MNAIVIKQLNKLDYNLFEARVVDTKYIAHASTIEGAVDELIKMLQQDGISLSFIRDNYTITNENRIWTSLEEALQRATMNWHYYSVLLASNDKDNTSYWIGLVKSTCYFDAEKLATEEAKKYKGYTLHGVCHQSREHINKGELLMLTCL